MSAKQNIQSVVEVMSHIDTLARILSQLMSVAFGKPRKEESKGDGDEDKKIGLGGWGREDERFFTSLMLALTNTDRTWFLKFLRELSIDHPLEALTLAMHFAHENAADKAEAKKKAIELAKLYRDSHTADSSTAFQVVHDYCKVMGYTTSSTLALLLGVGKKTITYVQQNWPKVVDAAEYIRENGEHASEVLFAESWVARDASDRKLAKYKGRSWLTKIFG